MPETLLAGFFVYFALFQPVALTMIFTKQKLHMLGAAWLALLAVLVALAAVLVQKTAHKAAARKRPDNMQCIQNGSKAALFAMLLLAAAVVCECAAGLLLQRSIGWDFAYYIGNMATSVCTDTMYLYDGSSGMKLDYMELRYALSGFYMNTAWISRLTGVPVLLLQKYVMGLLDILLADCALYCFAMEVFRKDRKKSAVLVSTVILMTVFWDVYDTSAQFLMLRGYEAKAYCANVVLPMVVFLCYRIWKSPEGAQGWQELFLVALASVAVSMSSILLVPAAIVLMLAAHMLLERRDVAKRLFCMGCCLLPNICYLFVMFLYQMKWLKIKV